MIVNHFPFPSDSFAGCPGIWDRFAVFASMVSRCLMPVPVCAIALGLFVIGLLAFLSDVGPTDHFALGRLVSF